MFRVMVVVIIVATIVRGGFVAADQEFSTTKELSSKGEASFTEKSNSTEETSPIEKSVDIEGTLSAERTLSTEETLSTENTLTAEGASPTEKAFSTEDTNSTEETCSIVGVPFTEVLSKEEALSTEEDERDEDALIPQLNLDHETLASLGELNTVETTMKDEIDELETLMALVGKQMEEGIISKVQVNKVFTDMAKIISNIHSLITNEADAEAFVRFKGFDRAVYPNLRKPSKILRTRVISLLKWMLNTTPITTRDNLSVQEARKLIELLKFDKNIKNKALVIDVFSKWLPENPKLQKEIVDNNGLGEFYSILPTIGTHLKVVLINLLDSLITENLNANDSGDLQKLYEQVGLLDVLKQRDTCDGLFNLFEELFSSAPEDLGAIGSMARLMEKVLPFCQDVFKNTPNANALFTEMERFYDQDKNVVEKPAQEAIMILEVIKKYRAALAARQKDEL